MTSYGARIAELLTPEEKQLFKRLNTPQKIQDYLEHTPLNFEHDGETYMSPRRLIRAKKAHCFEGALFAAAVLSYHGESPMIMDFQTLPSDDEHVIALFKQEGRWGAISKTNHAILRYRDPVYESPRELAMSYFHEYMMDTGVKSMRTYSAPIDLSRYAPEKWVTAEEDLIWLVDAVDATRHFPVAPKKNLKLLRKGTPVERRALKTIEWRSRGQSNK